MSTNSKISRQQRIQFKLRTNTLIQNVTLAFLPDRYVLKFCSTYFRRKSRLRRSTLPRPVCESSFWTSQGVRIFTLSCMRPDEFHSLCACADTAVDAMSPFWRSCKARVPYNFWLKFVVEFLCRIELLNIAEHPVNSPFVVYTWSWCDLWTALVACSTCTSIDQSINNRLIDKMT